MTNRNELERLLAAAAEGPWEAIGTDSVEGRDWCWLKAQPNSVICVFTKGTGAINGSQSDPMPQANAALTCFLRNNAQHYLSLMDEVERLREALADATEALADIRQKPYAPWPDPDPDLLVEEIKKAAALIGQSITDVQAANITFYFAARGYKIERIEQ